MTGIIFSQLISISTHPSLSSTGKEVVFPFIERNDRGREPSQAFFSRKMQQCVIFFLFHISFFCIAIKERNMVRGTGRHKPLKKSTLIDSGLQAGMTEVNICYFKALAEELQQTPIITFSQKGRNKYSKPAD